MRIQMPSVSLINAWEDLESKFEGSIKAVVWGERTGRVVCRTSPTNEHRDKRSNSFLILQAGAESS